MKRKTNKLLMGIGLCLLVSVTTVGNILAFGTFSSALESFFGVEGGNEVDFDNNQYFERELSSAEEASKLSAELCEEVEAEGAVLLKNNREALPLSKSNKVSCFGQASVDFIKGVTGGSGAIDAGNLTFEKALRDAGLQLNDTLFNFYKTQNKHRVVGGLAQGVSKDPYVWKLNEVPISEYNDNVKSSYSSYNDAAIVVISRTGCENGDLPQDMSSSDSRETRGETSILELNQDEKDMLKHVSESGFKKTIVLLNTTNTMECGFLDEYNIDACLWVGGVGQYGLNAVADILVGNVNPSGKLVDTYVYDVFSSPAMQNMGNYAYVDNKGNETGHHYVTYAEGIYVGYKYYETRYEDKIINRANVGNYDYDTTVQYPFGFGMSYTSFEWSNFEYTRNGDEIEVSVNVTNTGTKNGKEVVQAYYQSPYTDYDKEKGIEKSAVNLVDFYKTKELKPNESEVCKMTFPVEYFKSYDAKGEKTYLLEEGDYYITLAKDAHSAINNILKEKEYDVDGDKSFVKKDTLERKVYAKDTFTGADISNKFDDADGGKKYLTRNNWKEMDNSGLRDGTNPNNRFDADGYIYENQISNELKAKLELMGYAASGTPETDFSSQTFGANNGKLLVDMMNKEFDDKDWEPLLDQLQIAELKKMVSVSGYKTYALASVGKPYATDSDGTSAWTSFVGDGINAGGMPNETVQASTYNKDLEYKVGSLMGELALWAKITSKNKAPNLTGWYAPAMNIHRTPFGGRNFEYYSEDAMLSARIGSLVVKGATDKGVISYIKHFAFNEQETNRMTDNVTWGQEQALREIYLFPFEMSIKEGKSKGLMTAYNRIGTTWTGGCYNLITGIVRQEWGFNGVIITDYMDGDWENIDQMLAAGGDMALAVSAKTGVTTDTAQAQTYLRRAAHHLLYAFVGSNGMNGITASSIISGGTPTYHKYMIAFNLVMGVSILTVGYIFVYKLIKEIKFKKEHEDLKDNEEEVKKAGKMSLLHKLIVGGVFSAVVISSLVWVLVVAFNKSDKESHHPNDVTYTELDKNVDLLKKYGYVSKQHLSDGYQLVVSEGEESTSEKIEERKLIFDDKARGYYYEAEYATLENGARVEENASCSNGQNVGYMSMGTSMTFTITSEVDAVVLLKLSSSKNSTTDSLISDIITGRFGLNKASQNMDFGSRTFVGTGSWNSYIEDYICEVELKKGTNQITLNSFEERNYDYMCLVSPISENYPAIPYITEQALKEKYGTPRKDILVDGSETMEHSTDVRGYYYEAEKGQLGGNAGIENNGSCSGGQNVAYFEPLSTFAFKINAQQETDVLVMVSAARYGSYTNPVNTTLLVEYGNSMSNLKTMVESDCIIKTNNAWGDYQESIIGEIHLTKGINIITFKSLLTTNYDYICLTNPFTGEEPELPVDPIEEKYGTWTKSELKDGSDDKVFSTNERGYLYEAEKATLSEGINIENNSSASNGQNIGSFEDNRTAIFEIDVKEEAEVLMIISGARYWSNTYQVSDLIDIEYGINNNLQKVNTEGFTYVQTSASWSNFKEFKVGELRLQKGKNIIKITGKVAMNVDYFGLINSINKGGLK